MKKLFLIIVMVVAICPVIFAQEEKGIEFDVVAAPIALPLDGSEMDFISSQPMIGLTYPVKVLGFGFTPGAYLFGNLAAKNGDTPNWEIGAAAGVKVKEAVIGLAYTVIKEGDGLQGPDKSSLSILVGLTIF